MTEYVAAQRPWQNLKMEDEVEAVRETFAHGKSAQVVSFYLFLFLFILCFMLPTARVCR